jgi:hypothetical protein
MKTFGNNNITDTTNVGTLTPVTSNSRRARCIGGRAALG